MATLVKQNGRYALQFYDPSRSLERKRLALKTGDERTAQARQCELEHDYSPDRFVPWTDDPFMERNSQKGHTCYSGLE